MNDGRIYLEHDWYAGGIPGNVEISPTAYLDSSYGFAAFASERNPGLVIGEASGAYDRAAFVVGRHGRIDIGAYTCLNGTYVVCHRHVRIGDHCLLSWGVVVCDAYLPASLPLAARRALLRDVARHPERPFPQAGSPAPVTIEDNVWVGFDAVILPGVTIGRGSIIGCKTIVRADVEPYTIVAGDPARSVRELPCDDGPQARQAALAACLREEFRR